MFFVRMFVVTLTLMAGATFPSTVALAWQEKKDGKPFMTIDLSNLDQIKGKGERRLRLTLVAADNTTWIADLRFKPGENVAKLAFANVTISLREKDWRYEEMGLAVTVWGYVDTNGKLHPIKSVHASSEGTYPLQSLPRINASPNVKIMRSAEPTKN